MLVERCLPFYFSFLVRHVQSHDHARKQGTAWRHCQGVYILISSYFNLAFNLNTD